MVPVPVLSGCKGKVENLLTGFSYKDWWTKCGLVGYRICTYLYRQFDGLFCSLLCSLSATSILVRRREILRRSSFSVLWESWVFHDRHVLSLRTTEFLTGVFVIGDWPAPWRCWRANTTGQRETRSRYVVTVLSSNDDGPPERDTGLPSPQTPHESCLLHTLVICTT